MIYQEVITKQANPPPQTNKQKKPLHGGTLKKPQLSELKR